MRSECANILSNVPWGQHQPERKRTVLDLEFLELLEPRLEETPSDISWTGQSLSPGKTKTILPYSNAWPQIFLLQESELDCLLKEMSLAIVLVLSNTYPGILEYLVHSTNVEP